MDFKRKNIVWIDEGKIITGDIEAYMEFRSRAANYMRVNSRTLDEALGGSKSGVLTASRTMEVCRRMGIPLAVTCGMGGLSNIEKKEICTDLSAFAELNVMFISTGPRDMLERRKTLQWLIFHGIKVVGPNRGFCMGYLFRNSQVELQGTLKNVPEELCASLLIINEISEEKRIYKQEILEKAIKVGEKSQEEGCYFIQQLMDI